MVMPVRISSSERPFPNSEANVAIAAKRACARKDQIAQACQSTQSLSPGTKRDGQTGHLRQSASDEGRERVRAKAQPLASARGNRHDVFHGAGQFDAEYVVIGVQAKCRSGKFFLQKSRDGVVVRSELLRR